MTLLEARHLSFSAWSLRALIHQLDTCSQAVWPLSDFALDLSEHLVQLRKFDILCNID